MSEIADELERMAKELDEAAAHTQAARELPKHRELEQLFAGAMTGYSKSAERLRERAAELRQQRNGTTYKPQTKPAAVGSGQWWSVDDRPAMRVKLVFRSDGQNWATFGDGIDWHPSAATEAMMSNGRWRYHGDGERPEPAR